MFVRMWPSDRRRYAFETGHFLHGTADGGEPPHGRGRVFSACAAGAGATIRLLPWGTAGAQKGETVRGRPSNRLRIPFPHYITEVHTGYFLGIAPTLSFQLPETGQVFDSLSSALRLEHLLFDIGRDMSICGAGFVLVWLERSGLRACRCDPLSCFPVRGDGGGAPLLGACGGKSVACPSAHPLCQQLRGLRRF